MLMLLKSHMKFAELDSDPTIGALCNNYPIIKKAVDALLVFVKTFLQSDLERQEMDLYQYADLQEKFDQCLDSIRLYLQIPGGGRLEDGIPCRLRALEGFLNRARHPEPWFLSAEEIHCTTLFNRFVEGLGVEYGTPNSTQTAQVTHTIPTVPGANFPIFHP
jgi:hypothetical protein